MYQPEDLRVRNLYTQDHLTRVRCLQSRKSVTNQILQVLKSIQITLHRFVKLLQLHKTLWVVQALNLSKSTFQQLATFDQQRKTRPYSQNRIRDHSDCKVQVTYKALIRASKYPRNALHLSKPSTTH